jgi:DNA polymerase II small subunit
MREHLVAFFESHHRLVESDALALLLSSAEPLAISRRLVEETPSELAVVTREMVELILMGRAGASQRLASGSMGRSSATASALSRSSTNDPEFELVMEGFSSPTEGKEPLEAYSGLFTSRYRSLSRFLKGRPDLANLRTIREAATSEGSVALMGMVSHVRRSPEKQHLLLSLEDETGTMDLLVPRDQPLSRETFLPDEVVGVNVQLPRERGRLAVVRRMARPEVPLNRPTHRSPGPGRVMFLSDLHIGSRSFLSEAWDSLAAFLHGKEGDGELAQSITHVVIAGDLVDGIGIYPNQEGDLAISDIVEQYRELGRRLQQLPQRLNIVAIPGNHDAVCPAEPQPALPAELSRSIPPNVRLLGNPSTFALDGVLVEAYHGRSFDDLIPALPGADYSRPTEVMKRMLAMRHLAPIYGGRTPLAPLPRDGLIIDPLPDVLVTGHAHTYGVDQYRGILLLNASTWQAMTEYQRMRNIKPVPARAAVVRLSDLSLTSLDFSGAPEIEGIAS